MFAKGDRVVLALLGSFNPPTIAHLRMLDVAKDALNGTGCEVLQGFMSPVADAYGKHGLASAHHRKEMVRLAVSTSAWIRATEWEADQTTWTRTVLVLRHLKQVSQIIYGDGVKVALVAGTDVVESFIRIQPNGEPLWTSHDLKEILSQFGLVCINRENGDPAAVLSSLEKSLNMKFNMMITEDHVCPNSISSTRVRAALKQGLSVNYVVTDAVADYCTTTGLYK